MRWLNFAYLNVIRNKRRSIFTILVCAIATVAILTAVGFASFTYQSLAQKAARDEGALTISHPLFFDDQEDMPMQYGLGEVNRINEELSADRDVKAVLPRVNFNGLASNGDKSTIFVGLGVTIEEFRVKGPFLEMLAGNALFDSYDHTQLPQVVVASGLASSLKLDIGDSLTLLSSTVDGALNAFDYIVVGIYTTGVPDIDKRQLYVNIDSAQELLATERVSTVSVHLFDIEQTNTKLELFQKKLAEQYHKEVLISPWWQRAFYYQSVKDLYNRIFGLIGIIMLLLVFFSISNTMAMAVTERTREIGTMAAMGSHKYEVVRNFVLEAFIIASLGAVIGILTTAGISHLLIALGVTMPPPPGSSQSYPLMIDFSWYIAAPTTIVLIIICLVAALKSAITGANRNIINALTHI